MILKTRAEIQRLTEIASETLDANRDGNITDAELQDGYALMADDLESFGIDNIKDLHFLSSVYKPGTEVEKTPDGEFIVSSRPQSLRSDCIASYNNGQLMDAALQVEGDSPSEITAATKNLEHLELAWCSFYEKRVSRFNSSIFKSNFERYCNDKAWRQMGAEPTSFVAKLNNVELKQLYDGALLLEFLREQNVVYDAPQAKFFDFLTAGSGKHKGTCTILSTFALHLLKITHNDSFRPILMSDHVTLCLETSQGLIYLGAAANLGFQPPGYYENQPPEKSVRRVGESPAEPWQVLGEVYYNVGQSLYEKYHNEEAKLYLESSLEICPENVTAQYLLGSTLKYLGDKKRAREHYLKALAINPNYELARKAYDEIVSDQ